MSERYEIKTLKEAFGIVKDKDLEIIISEFERDFRKIARFTGIYISVNEVVKGIRERVFDGLNDKYLDLKSRISYARKHGADLNPLDFGVLRVPLKVKMLDAVFNLENYKLIVVMLNEDEKQLIVFEKQVEDFEEAREIRDAKREGRKPILKNSVKMNLVDKEVVEKEEEKKVEEKVVDNVKKEKLKVKKKIVKKIVKKVVEKKSSVINEKSSLKKRLLSVRKKIAAAKGLRKE